MTTSFYVPPSGFAGERVTFTTDEARHAAGVLRHRPGDIVRVVDGAGRACRVRLEQADKHGVAGIVEGVDETTVELPFEVTLGIGLIKNRGRFETVLEKATELGVHSIAPFTSERTERDRVREARAESILIAAMKQSHRSILPRLEVTAALDALIDSSAHDVRLICHEAAMPEQEGPVRIGPGSRVLVLVGPEGGFSEREVRRAVDAGFIPWKIAARRLRADTAAITALSILAASAESIPTITKGLTDVV